MIQVKATISPSKGCQVSINSDRKLYANWKCPGCSLRIQGKPATVEKLRRFLGTDHPHPIPEPAPREQGPVQPLVDLQPLRELSERQAQEREAARGDAVREPEGARNQRDV